MVRNTLEQMNPEARRSTVLDIPVCVATMPETVDAMKTLLEDGGNHLVATADASGIVIAQSDADLAKIYQEASWVTADSYGVVWALRRKGITAERVSGVDLAQELFALSAAKGYRIFLLGSAPGVAEEAAERIRLQHPGCNIVGTRHGYFPASDDEVVAEEVAGFSPDILLVALGIPRQEKFIRSTMSIIRPRLAVGVGGTLDVASGRVKRAPVFVQKLRIEWLWRTLSNPKKISKAKTLPRFALMVLRSKR